ncbi:MAG: hypothetical protein HRU11_04195 [Parvularculaceae bacterium]|nr:hypothetical protein [Parvularculaceae bacterium]
MRRVFVIVTAFLALGSLAGAQAQDDAEPGLYRVTTMRAAPGLWKDLRVLIEGQGEAGKTERRRRTPTYRIRHAQGAQWDFMLIQPMDSMENYFSRKVQEREAPFRSALVAHVDFSEDWIVEGPPHEVFAKAYPDAGVFLVEMFRARAGKIGTLEDSRHRENEVLGEIGRPQNFVFTGVMGADWDVMTIGLYPSWEAYGAQSSELTPEQQDEIARKHGYDGMADLAPSLRALLTSHSDTLATAMP